jgi:replicative DNA helicase
MTIRESAEIAVLGCCLVDPKCYWKIADSLDATDFSKRDHTRLYAEIARRAREGEDFDPVTIADAIPDLAQLGYACSTDEGWRGSNIVGYAKLVAEAAIARRIKAAGLQIAHLDGDDMGAEAQRILAACAPRNAGAIKHIRDFLRLSTDDIMRRHASTEKLTGIRTGIPALDNLTEGWQPTDLIIIAARPSVGKTAFAMQCVLAAARSGKNALVFSLEMNGKQINDRVTSAIGRVNGQYLRNPKQMPEEDWAKWGNACTEIRDLPIYIDESSGISVDVICARARQQHAITPLSLIVIDYLTMIAPPKAQSTTDALQIVTRTLKGLAKELRIPVIALSQLNRGGEGARPTFKTLRDSGSIEQDADVVIFLHRPSESHHEYLELILAKQRNGPTGDLAIDAEMRFMTMTQATRRPEGVDSHAETSADREWDQLDEITL